jgi:hypothetical protein
MATEPFQGIGELDALTEARWFLTVSECHREQAELLLERAEILFAGVAASRKVPNGRIPSPKPVSEPEAGSPKGSILGVDSRYLRG